MNELHGNGPCGLCGRDPSVGFASIGDVWYCHGDFDPDPTCYMQAQRGLLPADPADAAIERVDAWWNAWRHDDCDAPDCQHPPTTQAVTNYGSLGWFCDDHYAEIEAALTPKENAA